MLVVSVITLSLALQTASPSPAPIPRAELEEAIEAAERALDKAAASLDRAAAAKKQASEPCYRHIPSGPVCPAIDQRQGPSGATPRHVPLSALINPGKDYPDSALRNDEQGKVQVELAVDAKGLISDCTIVRSSSSSSLDRTSCGLMKARAWFWPALDRNGRAIASTVRHEISWELSPANWTSVEQVCPMTRNHGVCPTPFPRPARLNGSAIRPYPPNLNRDGETKVGYRVWIDPDGRVLRCDIESPSGIPFLDYTTCNDAMKDRYSPAVVKGERVHWDFEETLTWQPRTSEMGSVR